MFQHRHKRGKAHFTAEVCPNTFLDKDSVVGPASLVVNSVIKQSWINGIVINTYVEGTKMTCGNLTGGRVVDCKINGGFILGDAVAVGITVDRMMRIGTGTWTRAPRYFEIENDITHVGVTESTNGYAYIACQRKLMTTWLKGKKRFGKAVGWSPEVLDLLEKTFTTWLENPIPTF